MYCFCLIFCFMGLFFCKIFNGVELLIFFLDLFDLEEFFLLIRCMFFMDVD